MSSGLLILRVSMLSIVALLTACGEKHQSLTAPIDGAGLPISASVVPELPVVGQISAGGYHTCAVKTDGGVVCWGRDYSGQSTPPVGLVAVQVTSGANHSCALKGDGSVVCWGSNSVGQNDVPYGLVASHVSAGAQHTCAVQTGETVVCWGTPALVDDKGQTTVPDGLVSSSRVVAGLEHTCALRIDGAVACWGSNFNGQTDVPTGLVAVEMSGRWLHTCAVRADRTAVCWGYGPLAAMPSEIAASQVSPGNAHTCALLTDTTVRCWGYNADPLPEDWARYGQTDVPFGLSRVVQISSGSFHTCALARDGVVVCWGLNENGQTVVPRGLNLIVTPRDVTPPVAAPTLSTAANGAGWNNTDVTVFWNWTDEARGSGIDARNCTASSRRTTGEGTIVLTATCGDLAGNAGRATKTVKVDKTAPVVGYAGNAGSYTVDQTVAITCSASDALSGLASSTCANVNGAAYTFAMGSNTFSASATDVADNRNTGSTRFTVSVTAGSVCALVERWVSSAGVANSMCVKLQHGSYGPFRSQVNAQSGKAFLSAENAAILLRLVDLLG